ncbi:MAG: zinc-ribbon domain-containing protein, partial [Thermomicrobiales bacterium]
MILCPNCATPVREGARFCTTCGARIDGAAIPYVPPPSPQAAPDWDDQPVADAWPAPPATTTWPGQVQPWAPAANDWGNSGDSWPVAASAEERWPAAGAAPDTWLPDPPVAETWAPDAPDGDPWASDHPGVEIWRRSDAALPFDPEPASIEHWTDADVV